MAFPADGGVGEAGAAGLAQPLQRRRVEATHATRRRMAFTTSKYVASRQSISMIPDAGPPAIANAGSACGVATGSVCGGRRGSA